MQAYIAHMGIITSIGRGTEQNLASLLQSQSGISRLELWPSVHDYPVGEIKLTNRDLSRTLRAPSAWPRTALLSLAAAKEAWAPFTDKSKGLRIAFISANTVGGMDVTEGFYAGYWETKSLAEVHKLRYHESGQSTRLVQDALRIRGWGTTISTACSSSANSIMMGARLIGNGAFDVALVGGADALSRFTLNGFHALQILDPEACRPFDENRQGLNLGEGAAYLVLANARAMEQWGQRALGIVSGYANANDAHHQTASSPEGRGNRMAMEQALRQAGLEASQIDYINLHGTGTLNNDLSEGVAITDIFGKEVPLASSTKAFTGHTLAAAGAVEAVFSLLSLQNQRAWPSLRIREAMTGIPWRPITEARNGNIRRVLSNSFGFGGNCSSLVFSAL